MISATVNAAIVAEVEEAFPEGAVGNMCPERIEKVLEESHGRRCLQLKRHVHLCPQYYRRLRVPNAIVLEVLSFQVRHEELHHS